MSTINNAKCLMLGTLLTFSVFSIAADLKMDPYQEINTNINIDNNRINSDNNFLYRKNTEINQLNRNDNIRDKCVEVKNKINRKKETIDFSIRSRNLDLEQKSRQELQDLQGQEAQYCNE